MSDPELSALWDAAAAFVTYGSRDAAAFLQDTMHCASRTVNVSPTSLLPRFLSTAALQYQSGAAPASLLLLAAILNRQFCLRAVPIACARPLNDGRPSDLTPLLRHYITIIHNASLSSLPLPHVTTLQLLQAAAVLLLLSTEDVAASFGSVTHGDACLTAWLADAAMSVLSDRRVPIGPVRRSAQRKCLQRAAEVLIAPLPDECLRLQWRSMARGAAFTSRGTLLAPQEAAPLFWSYLPAARCWLSALAVSHRNTEAEGAVCAVLRAMGPLIDEAGEALLMGALSAALAMTESVGAMGPACRMISAAVEAAMETVLATRSCGDVLFDAMAQGAMALRRALTVATAANNNKKEMFKETHTEAEEAEEEEEEACLAACEGLSVLAQVLTPMPLAPMEETDDAEDYALMEAETHTANARKAAVLAQLSAFVRDCHAALRARLEAFTVSDASAVAEFALQTYDNDNENDNDNGSGLDVFAVHYDALPVAVFTTFARLNALLTAAAPHCNENCAVGSRSAVSDIIIIDDRECGGQGLEAGAAGPLDHCGELCLPVLAAASFCTDKDNAIAIRVLSLCTQWCAAQGESTPIAIAIAIAHTPLLPMIVRRCRYVWAAAPHLAAARGHFVCAVAMALRAATASGAWDRCAALSDALSALLFLFHQRNRNMNMNSVPLVECRDLQNCCAELWNAVRQCPLPAVRLVLAQCLAECLDAAAVPLPLECIAVLSTFDFEPRAELLSCALGDMSDVWRVMDALRCVEHSAAVCLRAAQRTAAFVRRAAAASSASASSSSYYLSSCDISAPPPPVLLQDAYSAAVRAFALSSPLHFSATWRFATAMGAADAADVLAGALEAFTALLYNNGGWDGASSNTNNSNNNIIIISSGGGGLWADCFSPFVLETLASAPPPHCMRLLRVLRYLLRGPNTSGGFSSSYSYSYSSSSSSSSAWRKLRAVAEGGERLLWYGRCDAAELAALFCEAAVEFARQRHSLAQGDEKDWDNEDNWDNGDNEEEKDVGAVLAALSKFGAVLGAAEAPGDSPDWVKAMRGAADEYELCRMLERA